ncbi:T9SS type A sorting domain-containing protein [candidate division KSB1 bacterium]|nr:T9SS type A sorting domain-containing protein [candidate division KSB1 bacterium]
MAKRLLIFVLILAFSSAGWAEKQYMGKRRAESVPSKLVKAPREMQLNGFDMRNYIAAGTIVGTSTLDYATSYGARSIAVGSDGAIHVVWCTGEDSPNPAQVLYARSTDHGKTFSMPIELQDGYYGYKPSVAVDPNNPLTVFVPYVGHQNRGETRSIRFVKSEDGGLTWSASIPIFGTVTDCNNPACAVDSKGNPHVVFGNYTDSQIRINFSLDGGETWLPEPELVTLGFAEPCFMSEIVIDKDDNIHIFAGAGGSSSGWGDKGVVWTWRTWGTSGFLMEVPPVELGPISPGVGSPFPSAVVTSDNHIHLWYDNEGVSGAELGIYYREYDGSSWSEAEHVASSIEGASTYAPSASVDVYDNLYLMYIDALEPSPKVDPVFTGDLFSGTNAVEGQWQFVNLSANGVNVPESHPNAANWVAADSFFHVAYTTGTSAPYNIMHQIAYPWPPEPTCGVNQLPCTYNTEGPFKVEAGTGDIDGVVVGCKLHVFQNGTEIHAIDMTELEKDKYEAEFSVEGAVGDTILYYGISEDNDGNIGQSMLTTFLIIEPINPNVDFLLIDDDGRLNDEFWTPLMDCVKTADGEKYNFELWDISTRKGIDASVTTFGWKTIFIHGYSVISVPTRDYEGNAYAAFLNSGTEEAPVNLCLASPDYFLSQGESQGDVAFDPGDFVYDFFQISSGNNDPREEVGGEEVAPDSMLLGTEGDPISGSFATEPLWLQAEIADIANWIDYTAAIDPANDIFLLYNLGLTAGTKYDGTSFKTVFLPWLMAHLVKYADPENGDMTVVPQDEAYVLMENILHWFGTEAGEALPSAVDDIPEARVKAYHLAQNYPNPFNPVTHIDYSVPRASHVEIAVYNSLGQKIRTLVDKNVNAGHHTVTWNGMDEAGSAVSSGLYFYQIKSENFSKTHKMVLLK